MNAPLATASSSELRREVELRTPIASSARNELDRRAVAEAALAKVLTTIRAGRGH